MSPPSDGSLHFRFSVLDCKSPSTPTHLQIQHSFLSIAVLFHNFFPFSVAADSFCLLIVLFCFSLVLSEHRKAKLNERELEKTQVPPTT